MNVGLSPVFILTTGRSGSTSIANILNMVDGCFCAHEPSPELILESSAYRYGTVSSQTIQKLLRETRTPNVTNTIYCESNQNLSLIIPELATVYPQARFIWLIRNGLDVVASAYQKQWYSGHSENHSKYENCPPIEKAWIDGRIRGDRLGELSEIDWAAMDRFEKCCWYWGYVNRIIEEDLEGLVPDKFFTIRLEEMDQNFPRLLSWMGLSFSPDYIIVRDNIAKRTPFHWTEWSPKQKRSFSHWCGCGMDRFYPSWRNIWGENSRFFIAPAIAGLKQMVNEQQKRAEEAQEELYSIKSSCLWHIYRLFVLIYNKKNK